MLKAFNIAWETDGEPVALPAVVYLPADVSAAVAAADGDAEPASDYLSDRYGWLVESFDLAALPPVAAAWQAASKGNGFVCYGSGEPEAAKLARAFAFYRQAGKPAADAMRLARERVASGKRIGWPSRFDPSRAGEPGADGGRWIERPDLAGFRFVGFADKLASGRRISHTGWFLYPGGDPGEVARGCVYRMAGRGGRSVYVEAVQTGEDTRGGWRDVATGGDEWKAGATFYFGRGDIHRGESGGEQESSDGDDSAQRDAAYGADGYAERYAERERDYQESYALGREAAEAIEAADAERKAARELMRELRGLASLPAAVCAELRASIAGKLRRARRGYAKAAALWREHGEPVTWRPDLADAFAEAAGAASYWESRK